MFSGSTGPRLDSEWYLEAADGTAPADRTMKLVLEPDEEFQLSVTDNLAENADVDFVSSDAAVASVNGNGMIKAAGKGNTVITVKNSDGSYQDQIPVLVVDDASEYRLALDMNVGQSCRLTVDDLTFSKKVTWSTADEKTATADNRGSAF